MERGVEENAALRVVTEVWEAKPARRSGRQPGETPPADEPYALGVEGGGVVPVLEDPPVD